MNYSNTAISSALAPLKRFLREIYSDRIINALPFKKKLFSLSYCELLPSVRFYTGLSSIPDNIVFENPILFYIKNHFHTHNLMCGLHFMGLKHRFIKI